MEDNRSFLKSYFKKIPVYFIILLILFCGAILLFTLLVHEVLVEKEEVFDHKVFDFIAAHFYNDGITGAMKTVTYFASSTFLQIAYAVLFLLYLLRKNFKRSMEIAVIGVGGYLLNYIMKLSFHRLRPPHPLIDPQLHFSFPSGHATSGFIFYGTLVYLIWKSDLPKPVKYISGIILILFSLLIGFSRIYLRVHYASDVLAGFCIGFSWLLIAVYVLEKLKKKANTA